MHIHHVHNTHKTQKITMERWLAMRNSNNRTNALSTWFRLIEKQNVSHSFFQTMKFPANI